MLQIDPERFDALVDDAIDLIPGDLAAMVHNVVVLVEEEPPPSEPADTLGLYDGGVLGADGAGYLPDRIFVFRQPLLAMCRTEDELVREVRITVIHEVAHHFGIDDDRLHELGWE